jgi:pimeloyl-ACP methyl ester carboxylesterase
VDLRRIEIGGRSFAYREAGHGPAVLYLHGFPTSGYLWRKPIDRVSAEFRAVAPDLPGFGDSDMLEGPHTWEALCSWVDAFVNTLGLAPLHLAVHDWGGLIGLRWACDHPEKVSSLLITDTSFSSRDRWHAMAQEWRKPEVGEQLIGATTEEGFEAMMRAISPTIEDSSIKEFWKGMSTQPRRDAKLDMYRSLDFPMLAPFEPILPTVAPGRVKFIWGELDPFVPPKTAYRLQERLGGEVKILEGAGHFLQEDRGEASGDLHLEFLRSLG